MISQPNNQESFANAAANSNPVPQPAASNGNVPHVAAEYGSAPQLAAEFGNTPQSAERKQSHTLSVKQVARMFEEAGVSRIERTIVNWCQPNKHGVARLDAYFDPNERRYLITPESVDRAIKEEQAKAARQNGPETSTDNSFPEKKSSNDYHETEAMEEIRLKLRDAEINSRFKDRYIAKLESEHGKMLEQLMAHSRTIGQLETQLLQLEKPKEQSPEARRIHVVSDSEAQTYLVS